MTIKTESGYTIEFPKGLDGDRPEAQMTSPYRGDTVAIPFVISGEPGLLDVRFRVRNAEDGHASEDRKGLLDYYIHPFTAVLRPGGFFTNFFGRGKKELRGELTVPKRLFPIEVCEVTVENLSAKKFEPSKGAS